MIMKEMIKYSRVCGYLEKIYRQLNNDYFNNELEEVVITIQSTKGAYGHVTCGKVWKTGDCSRYELNIGAGTLYRPIENIVATMLHEMVHIYNLMNDIKDTSRGNTYHNKRFKEKAESVGLIIEHDKRIGWSITRPSDELILYICNQGWQEIMITRNEGYSYPPSTGGTGGDSAGNGDNESAPTKIKKPSSTRKYICPSCRQSVRATRDTLIICGYCSELMEKEGA